MMQWIIGGPAKIGVHRLYWKESGGWAYIAEAQIFDDKTKESSQIPLEGEWVRLSDDRIIEILIRRGDPISLLVADRFETYRKLDIEASNYVESVICMRTNFTGELPYVGWKGLGLALNEALDERDLLRKRIAEIKEMEDDNGALAR